MLQSKNFFVSILTLVALFFAYFGVELPNTPSDIIDSAEGLGLVGLITSVILPNFFNPIIKLIAEWKLNGFNWGFLQSPNFATQFSTVVLATLEVAGVTNTVLIAIIINVVNFLWHVIFDTLLFKRPVV